jgi:hypothetical protein
VAIHVASAVICSRIFLCRLDVGVTIARRNFMTESFLGQVIDCAQPSDGKVSNQLENAVPITDRASNEGNNQRGRLGVSTCGCDHFPEITHR